MMPRMPAARNRGYALDSERTPEHFVHDVAQVLAESARSAAVHRLDSSGKSGSQGPSSACSREVRPLPRVGTAKQEPEGAQHRDEGCQ
jgi:hypothetical protein